MADENKIYDHAKQLTLEKIVNEIIILDANGNPVDILPLLEVNETPKLNISSRNIHIVFTNKNFSSNNFIDVNLDSESAEYSATVILGEIPVTIVTQQQFSFEDSSGQRFLFKEGETQFDSLIKQNNLEALEYRSDASTKLFDNANSHTYDLNIYSASTDSSLNKTPANYTTHYEPTLKNSMPEQIEPTVPNIFEFIANFTPETHLDLDLILTLSQQLINEPDFIANYILLAAVIPENSPNNTVIGQVVSYPHPNVTSIVFYNLVDSAGGRFALDEKTGVVSVANSHLLDYESGNTYSISLVADVAGLLTIPWDIAIYLSDINEAPTVNTALIDQTVTAGQETRFSFAANAFTDEDGDTLAYSATQADGSALDSWVIFNSATREFSIDADLAAVGNYAIKVTAQDTDGLSVNDIFNISITLPANSLGSDGGDSLNLSDSNNIYYAFASNDSINGKGGDDIIYAGSGNDLINGGTGCDQLYGGHGDDTLIFDSNDSLIDGGLGFDTLSVEGNDDINLNIVGSILHDIEYIEMSSDDPTTLQLSVADVLAVNDQQCLFISAGAEDTIDLDNGWVATGNTDNTTVTGVTFNEYSNGNALLYLDQDIVNII
jgi:Ca2+-binding RTX toxin-like protein